MITVVSPGARTLIQDLGRPGYEHLGVPTSGAADPHSLRVANRLAGNPAGTAALEIALSGPTLTFTRDTRVGYAGADADLSLDGTPVPAFHTLAVRAGQTLSIGALHTGVYGYLAVAGGLTTPPVLGSRSACTLSGLGPTALGAGDTVPVGEPVGIPGYRATRRPGPHPRTLRYLPGPHADRFAEATDAVFAATVWTVSPDSSRVGVRLSGPALDVSGESLPSLGMVTGAIQVPPTGTPIVLGPDHGTTGGYPVLGVVLAADLPALLQRRAGTPVRFAPVTISEAVAADRQHAEAAGSLLDLDAISA